MPFRYNTDLFYLNETENREPRRLMPADIIRRFLKTFAENANVRLRSPAVMEITPSIFHSAKEG